MLHICREERGLFTLEMFFKSARELRVPLFRGERLHVEHVEAVLVVTRLRLCVVVTVCPAGEVPGRDRRGELPEL